MLWYVSIDDVEDAGPAGCFLQERVLATAEEREYVRRYIFPEDRKRSLLSLLLQHAVVRAAAGGAAYAIRRSREGKPYGVILPAGHRPVQYNVSHHGKYVCLAFCPIHWAIGVDIVSVSTVPRGVSSVHEYLQMFTDYFTKQEMALIKSGDGEKGILKRFYINWALKETIVKALGCGIGKFPLDKAHFTIEESTSCSGSASVTCDSIQSNLWSFAFFLIDEDHLVSIGVGPRSADVTEASERGREDVCTAGPVNIAVVRKDQQDDTDESGPVTQLDHRAVNRQSLVFEVERKFVDDLIPLDLQPEWCAIMTAASAVDDS